eukprot:CAMPEP_0172683484 /NCGR_PEP_ID=MMETSP1074-20121228/18884_1 /TAXON_ID=2916 /ORGANISM="Ceratium fusus, Strain PA161109" /LENGTH=39 /DNA_ID= /DNA_START= /DNA_END= /DNA_ORIENTATION=
MRVVLLRDRTLADVYGGHMNCRCASVDSRLLLKAVQELA